MKSVDLSLHHYFFPNIIEDGWKFISFCALFSLCLALIWFPLGLFSLVLTIWCFYCFRDPIRITPIRLGAIVAPADGVVVAINRCKGPSALGLDKKSFTRVTIYSSPFDVIINRMPIKASIHKTFYDAGKNCSTSFNKDNIGNERFLFSFRNTDGLEFVIQQTATFCSHRVVCNVKNNDAFLTGQRFGFIRFGGFTDLFLPDKIEPQICVGQTLIAGESIIADTKSDAPRMEGDIR